MARLEGMPRPIWSGSISFGLVNVPVKLYGAIESHRVAFHEFEEGTGQRIHHKRVSERSGREVRFQDERLSSVDADWRMARSGLTHKQKKERRDA